MALAKTAIRSGFVGVSVARNAWSTAHTFAPVLAIPAVAHIDRACRSLPNTVCGGARSIAAPIRWIEAGQTTAGAASRCASVGAIVFGRFTLTWAHGHPRSTCLNRKNNNGHYSPRNCRWVTRRTSENNKRSNRQITYRGMTRTVSEWALAMGVPYHALWNRLDAGWAVSKAFSASRFHCNTSGVVGVTWDRRRRKWQAFIGVRGGNIHLGRFDNLQHAATVRRVGERKYWGT